METGRNRKHIEAILDSLSGESFKIEKIIGDGHFNGVVIVKNNKLAGRFESIKFIESVEPNSRALFLNEGKILSAMQHKNIPQVYDIIEHGDVLLFRSEHIDGYSLKEVLDFLKEKNKEFPRLAATSIILKIMNALHYAHSGVIYENKRRCIIHGDVKPSNILLSANGYKRKAIVDEDFIKLLERNMAEPHLIDFGVAKFRGSKSDGSGTPQYMSPAQVRVGNSNNLDWRSDMHQLLLVYFELLTGKTPYWGFSRNKIIEEKLAHDFKVDKNHNISGQIRDFIEKGTRRKVAASFRSEKEYITRLSQIKSGQRRGEFIRRYKITIITIILVFLLVPLAFATYNIWDYNTRSIDSIIHGIESNSNPSPKELGVALERVQQRAFEKKYYIPLIKGQFLDKSTGKPLYPSYLDATGKWVLVGPETESAGAFAGLLFEYSDKYPGLLKYAEEYAEPILESKVYDTDERRFMYALIPAYEKTGDKKYLEKLMGVADFWKGYLSVKKGDTQCADLYQGELFLFLYNQTGNREYLNVFGSLTRDFTKNNIDSNGYVYEAATVNFTAPNGVRVSDDKLGVLVSPTGDYRIGSYISYAAIDENSFKISTSAFSRNIIEVLKELREMEKITNDAYYRDAIEKVSSYYLARLPKEGIDYLFVSNLNAENDIPTDTLAAVKSLYLFKELDNTVYLQKLKSLLSSKYFRKENEAGILSGSVLLDNIDYIPTDDSRKNQSLIQTDALFLELKK